MASFSFVLVAVFLGFVGLVTSQSQTPILYLNTEPTNLDYAPDVLAKLAPYYANVISFDYNYNTPSLWQLQQYKVVLCSAEGASSTMVDALAPVLVSFVNGGGLLIMCHWATDVFSGTVFTPNYWAITPAPSTLYGGDLTMTPLISNHPILAGVNSFNGGSGSYRTETNFQPTATGVANWSDGTPLIATIVVNGTARVDLNFWPTSSDGYSGGWSANTDGAKILANSITWLLSTNNTSPNTTCSANSDCNSCTSAGCEWCLDTSVCSGVDTSCPDRIFKPIYCPVADCSTFYNCTTCLTDGPSNCEWCLDTASCVNDLVSDCQSVLHNSQFCPSQ